jgi:hypothetical protein
MKSSITAEFLHGLSAFEQNEQIQQAADASSWGIQGMPQS